MKKSLIILNILTLFLTSCSSFKTSERFPAAAELSCTDIMKELMNAKDLKALKTELKSFVKIELTDEEMNDFFKEFNGVELSAQDEETYRAIFLYAKADADVRRDLFKEFHVQLKGSPVDENNKTWKKFAAHKKKVDERKQKMLEKETSAEGKKAAGEKGKIFEKLYYNCKTQIKGPPSPQVLKQAKHLTFALAAGGLGSTTISYTAIHWDDEKNQKWFNELYFTLGIGAVMSMIGSKLVMANPNLNPWTGKMPLAFLNNAIGDVGISTLYGFVFSSKDTVLEDKLQALESDPAAKEKIAELVKIAEERNLLQKTVGDVQGYFKDKKTGETMKSSDLDHEATIDDVDIEESRELLMAGLAEQEYQEKSGLMKTGYPAVDRFSYHRIYNLFSVPTNIGLTILMNNQMCMSEDPKKGFMKAVGLYMGAAVMMDALYFKGRKEVINQ